MRNTTVTTSWDDGHTLDVRLADLLKTYAIKATFYIAPKDHEFVPEQRLTEEQIRHIAASFEIGAHTMTHPDLTKLSEKDAKQEIEGSKAYLESVTGVPVRAFCYPSGRYASREEALVKDAGFAVARTTKQYASVITDPFTLPTTAHAYLRISGAWAVLRAVGIKRFVRCYLNWDELAIALFEQTKEKGGIFHLWGHSWEIEKYHGWQRLERVLAHIAQSPGVRFATNSELV